MRWLASLGVIAATLAGAPATAPAQQPIAGTFSACPVTIPSGPVHRGTGMWTPLPQDGVIRASRPQHTWAELQRDGWIRAKFAWFADRRASTRIRIRAKRLDRPGRPVRTNVNPGIANAPRFWASYVFFPSEGCWRVSGRSGRAHVSFVVAVVVVR